MGTIEENRNSERVGGAVYAKVESAEDNDEILKIVIEGKWLKQYHIKKGDEIEFICTPYGISFHDPTLKPAHDD